MNTRMNIALVVALGTSLAVNAETGAELIKGIFAQTNHMPKVLLDVRTRYEYAEQSNFDAANAATIRARVGLESQNYNGFTGLIEFEGTRAANTTSYRPGPYAASGKTVISDPESTELNRLQLQFSRDGNTLIAGRQRIILDNARFIGNVGWRQNEQTYDAFSYKNTMVTNVSFYYAYIDQVNRIFGSDAPGAARKYDSDSHLINASYTLPKGSKLTTYAYLLDFDNAEINSTDTAGVSYNVKGSFNEYTLTGLAEFAYQQEGDNASIDYNAPYYHLDAKAARDGYAGFLGYEVLGSDHGDAAFKTPLATLHAFNGWNDQFLNTPIDGLRDLYFGVGLPVPQVPITFVYHFFTSDHGSSTYGQEYDLSASHAFNKKTKAIAKVSYYDADDYSFDCTRFSIEMNFKY